MNERRDAPGAQVRADRPLEREAVRTTIVGGRPPGSGQSIGPIPRGIEVLVKKASVDPEFRKSLLTDPLDAAGEIGLTLDPAEKMMLGSVPAAQLEAIIARTHVPDRDRRAFLGKVAAVMLATMGLAAPACVETADKGIRPDDPKRDGRRDRFEPTTGSAPDPPPEPETPNEGETSAGIRPDVPPPPEPERRAEP